MKIEKVVDPVWGAIVAVFAGIAGIGVYGLFCDLLFSFLMFLIVAGGGLLLLDAGGIKGRKNKEELEGGDIAS